MTLLFLGYHNIFPDQLVISTSGIFVEQPTKWLIAPESAGRINRRFGEVADDEIYCYDNDGAHEYRNYEKGAQTGRILIQMTNERELKIEYQTGLCNGGAWQFTNPTAYNR